MVLVSESRRRSATFARLLAGMGQMTADASGIVVFDVCRHNLDAMELDRQILSFGRWFPGSSLEQVDEQKYFAARLPSRADHGLPVVIGPSIEDLPRQSARRLTQVTTG
jgi:hypothetical protein